LLPTADTFSSVAGAGVAGAACAIAPFVPSAVAAAAVGAGVREGTSEEREAEPVTSTALLASEEVTGTAAAADDEAGGIGVLVFNAVPGCSCCCEVGDGWG